MIFSLDLRKRVIAAVDDNMRITDVAILFKVSRRVIYEWLELREKTGSLVPNTGYQKGHSHKITDWDQFRIFAEEFKQCHAPQLIVEWKRLTNIDVSESVMYRALKKINYTSKKNF